ncbi:MAG: magnesium transporter [Clostridiales bacterium]|jgi:magnesium transporter|nr:magnesium transporter [Clostridiales bacterium]
MEENKFFESLTVLICEKKFHKLRAALLATNPVDIAEYIMRCDAKDRLLVYRILPKELAAEVFAYLDTDIRQVLVNSFTDEELTSVLNELFLDDTIDFLEEMPAYVVKKVLEHTDPDKRKIINQFLQYPDDSAGSLMTIEYVALNKNYTVDEAIWRIRRIGIDKETVYTAYVTDGKRVLEGVVTVKDLLLAKNEEIIAEIMDENVICAHTGDDKEKVSETFKKYDLMSMPVIDAEGRIVGIITIDDIVDVIQDEDTEDFEKMAALRPSEKPYLKSSVFTLAKNRISWLLVLMLSGIVSGILLGAFEDALLPVLVAFMPMLTDTGGNAGSQAATLVIRGLALGELNVKDYLKILWKEIRISLLLGSVLAAFTFVRFVIQYAVIRKDDIGVNAFLAAIVVSISVLFVIIMAKTVGSMLPIVAKKLRLDPAIMAAPLITTMIDALSLTFYFGMAKAILGI